MHCWENRLPGMNLVQHQGFAFSFDPSACRDCGGYCCRGGSGNIWVNGEEIKHIADFLNISPIEVIGTYLKPVGNRLSILERYTDGQYECVFFAVQTRQCSIYTVRPSQCRSFPFWPYYRDRVEELVEECPGVRRAG